MSEVQGESTEIETPEQDVQEEVSEVQGTEQSLEDKIEAMAKEGGEGGDDDEVEGDEPLAAANPDEGKEGEEKYEPTYKFKVKDEEHEIDEVLKHAVTSKEAEEKLIDLYERAYGLDAVKEDRDRFRNEYSTHKEALTKQTQAINTLSGYLDSGDYESFFNALDIPVQGVMQFALQQAQMQEWSPEQRAAHQATVNDRRRANLYEEQYTLHQEQLDSLRQDQVVKDYQLATYKPEVREFQQAFDQRNGQDAFRKEVAQLGDYYERLDGTVKPVEGLIGEVMNKFSAFMDATAPAPTQAAGQAQPQTQVAQPAEVPVIPNTGPAGQAPAQRSPKSLEDLEKMADEMR